LLTGWCNYVFLMNCLIHCLFCFLFYIRTFVLGTLLLYNLKRYKQK
jgi:hypothetical protein